MAIEPLTKEQINVLEESLSYDPSEDSNGAKGLSLADKLDLVFKGNPPKLSGLSKEKMRQYNLVASQNDKELYRTLSKQKFKGIFGRLKKKGYQGPDKNGMKDYSKMSAAQMWNYYCEIKRDLNIFR